MANDKAEAKETTGGREGEDDMNISEANKQHQVNNTCYTMSAYHAAVPLKVGKVHVIHTVTFAKRL